MSSFWSKRPLLKNMIHYCMSVRNTMEMQETHRLIFSMKNVFGRLIYIILFEFAWQL